ncbi:MULTISPECIES: hypothetical protein [Roseiflexus]|jgi:hypothetical protein|uniref:Uncharacterized protein n=1 Tax=Roseiflexus castenholzii (strain DSM 13941 / HLO8) TaxID=383372 RepID=A7NLG7_ROSCS|nr:MULTISPECIES: hypothetical protein [Roseiflexus]ABU58350.1 conserved hypothetical protein [Roseiflexus castenholzii DSM 13941]PMP81556.1 MAG: hypothetical protein C0183_12015 [Roseiflexus castenholzii]GIW01293.1 MAG: hypothetical protein KatS3mg058_2696 [Roseiflexus sp.]
MKLFRGLEKTDYQDVLRAIGLYIDEHGYTDVRIIEIEDGLVLQGRVREKKEIGTSSYETFLITDDDLKEMVRTAAERRGQKPPSFTQ